MEHSPFPIHHRLSVDTKPSNAFDKMFSVNSPLLDRSRKQIKRNTVLEIEVPFLKGFGDISEPDDESHETLNDSQLLAPTKEKRFSTKLQLQKAVRRCSINTRLQSPITFGSPSNRSMGKDLFTDKLRDVVAEAKRIATPEHGGQNYRDKIHLATLSDAQTPKMGTPSNRRSNYNDLNFTSVVAEKQNGKYKHTKTLRAGRFSRNVDDISELEADRTSEKMTFSDTIRRKSCHCSDCGGISKFEKKHLNINILCPRVQSHKLSSKKKQVQSPKHLPVCQIKRKNSQTPKIPTDNSKNIENTTISKPRIPLEATSPKHSDKDDTLSVPSKSRGNANLTIVQPGQLSRFALESFRNTDDNQNRVNEKAKNYNENPVDPTSQISLQNFALHIPSLKKAESLINDDKSVEQTKNEANISVKGSITGDNLDVEPESGRKRAKKTTDGKNSSRNLDDFVGKEERIGEAKTARTPRKVNTMRASNDLSSKVKEFLVKIPKLLTKNVEESKAKPVYLMEKPLMKTGYNANHSKMSLTMRNTFIIDTYMSPSSTSRTIMIENNSPKLSQKVTLRSIVGGKALTPGLKSVLSPSSSTKGSSLFVKKHNSSGMEYHSPRSGTTLRSPMLSPLTFLTRTNDITQGDTLLDANQESRRGFIKLKSPKIIISDMKEKRSANKLSSISKGGLGTTSKQEEIVSPRRRKFSKSKHNRAISIL